MTTTGLLVSRSPRIWRSRIVSGRQVPRTRQLQQQIAILEGAREVYKAAIDAVLVVKR